MRIFQKVVKARIHKSNSKANKSKTRRVARRKKK